MKITEAKAELEKQRGRTDIKLDELVQITNYLINLVVPNQPSDRVAETLNERTLRYYITEGLIDRPLGKEGTAALYGYRHLLQALIVKALQGAYLPIKRIKKILEAKNDLELEGILACQTLEMPRSQNDLSPLDAALTDLQEMDIHTARQTAVNYLDYLEGSSQPHVFNKKIDSVPPSPSAELNSVLYDAIPFLRREPRNKGIPAYDSWERFSLEDGIELHVRSDRVAGLRGSEIKRILERLLNLLKTRK